MDIPVHSPNPLWFREVSGNSFVELRYQLRVQSKKDFNDRWQLLKLGFIAEKRGIVEGVLHAVMKGPEAAGNCYVIDIPIPPKMAIELPKECAQYVLISADDEAGIE